MIYLKLNRGIEICMLVLSLMPEYSILMRIGSIIFTGIHLIPANFSADTGCTLANKFGNLFLKDNNNNGIGLFHPTELSDWIYAKIEYRNQKNFPFGISMQYSNNYLLSRVYVPLLGDWLYLDARYAYSTISAERARPFDVSTFMLSPVLRFNF